MAWRAGLRPNFVCDRCGRRWLAAWRDDGERLASRTPRVRVELRQLKTWYRTLDQLLEHKDTIEHALFITLRDRQSVRGRSGAPLQRAFRRRTLLRQPQGRHRHAADLSSHRGTRRNAHLRRRARLPASSRYREEAQGGADRSLRNRSLDGAPINPRRRYRPRQWHHQTRRHRSYPTRRGRAARHRHQRSRPAHPANPRPNHDVVTKQKSTPTKSKSYSRKRETWASACSGESGHWFFRKEHAPLKKT